MKLFKVMVKAGFSRFPILYSEWCELNEFLDSYLNMSLPTSVTQLFPTCTSSDQPDTPSPDSPSHATVTVA